MLMATLLRGLTGGPCLNKHMRGPQERDELSGASERSTTLRLKRTELRNKQDELDRLMRRWNRDLNALLPSQSQGAARSLLRGLSLY